MTQVNYQETKNYWICSLYIHKFSIINILPYFLTKIRIRLLVQ